MNSRGSQPVKHFNIPNYISMASSILNFKWDAKFYLGEGGCKNTILNMKIIYLIIFSI